MNDFSTDTTYPWNMAHEDMLYNEYVIDHKPLEDKRGTTEWAWMDTSDGMPYELLSYNPMRHERHE